MRALETERLSLREFYPSDAPFVIRLLNSDGWLRFIGNRFVSDDDQAKEFINVRLRPSYAQYGFGFYLVELKSTKHPIGMCGLVKREGLEHVDIGYAFLPEYFGKGYAFEASQAVVEFAKNDIKLTTLDSITLSNNTSSIKLLRKLDFKFVGNIKLNDEELALYRREF